MSAVAEIEKVVVIDGKPCNAETKKPLWGMPKKCWEQEQRIEELQRGFEEQAQYIANQNATIVALQKERGNGDNYDFEVWQRTGDTKTEKKGEPCRWRHFHADGSEWVYHERLAMWADSGYGDTIQERAVAMIGNAFGGMKRPDGSGTVNPAIKLERFGPLDKNGDQTWTMFPEFDPSNEIEVIIRVRRTKESL